MKGTIEIMDGIDFSEYNVELFFIKNYLVIQQQTYLEKPIYLKIAIEGILEVNLSTATQQQKLTVTTKNHLVHIAENGSINVKEIARFVFQGYLDTI